MAVKPLLTNTYNVLMAAAPPGSDTVIANVCDEPAPEEGVTETACGGPAVTVQLPSAVQPELSPPAAWAYPYTLLTPPKLLEKLRARLTVALLPDKAILELPPLIVHWLFPRVLDVGRVIGPCQAVAPSLSSNRVLCTGSMLM